MLCFSLWSEKDRYNIGSFRGVIQKLVFFSYRSEAIVSSLQYILLAPMYPATLPARLIVYDLEHNKIKVCYLYTSVRKRPV